MSIQPVGPRYVHVHIIDHRNGVVEIERQRDQAVGVFIKIDNTDSIVALIEPLDEGVRRFFGFEERLTDAALSVRDKAPGGSGL